MCSSFLEIRKLILFVFRSTERPSSTRKVSWRSITFYSFHASILHSSEFRHRLCKLWDAGITWRLSWLKMLLQNVFAQTLEMVLRRKKAVWILSSAPANWMINNNCKPLMIFLISVCNRAAMAQWWERLRSPPTNVAWVWFRPGVIWGLSFVVGSRLAPRVFLRALRFSSLHKNPTPLNSHLTRKKDPRENRLRLTWLPCNLFTLFLLTKETNPNEDDGSVASSQQVKPSVVR